MTHPFGLALVGLGMAVTPHAKALADLQDRVALRQAWSPSVERRRAFAATYCFPIADTLDAVLADPTVEAVAILTPPHTHLDLVRRTVAAGKHVLLEKPLEIDIARAEAVVETCRAAGRTLGIVFQHRFRPAGERLAAVLAKGGLGRLVGASASIRLWRPQSYYDQPGRGVRARDGGGVLLTQGIHTLDLLLSLAGPAADVAAFATTTAVHRMETEDMAVAAVRFANGALGVIDATTAAYPGAPERIELIGTEGTASLAGTALSIRWQDGRTEEMVPDATPGGAGADPMAFPHDYHRALILDFVEAVRTGRSPRADGAAGLRVQRLVEGILESAAARQPIALAL